MSPDPKWLNLIQTCLEKEGASPISRFLQLATLTTTGKPAVRTVVFRGWLSYPHKHGNHPATAIKIVTDDRSHKVTALLKYPWAEICWYFAEARKQFRITTDDVRVIRAGEADPFFAKARVDQWKDLSDSSRAQFCFPPPGQPRVKTVDGSDPFDPEPPSPTEPEDAFVLILVQPSAVDVVDLRQNTRQLFLREKDFSWGESFLNP